MQLRVRDGCFGEPRVEGLEDLDDRPLDLRERQLELRTRAHPVPLNTNHVVFSSVY
jgi:hypothetical protein